MTGIRLEDQLFGELLQKTGPQAGFLSIGGDGVRREPAVSPTRTEKTGGLVGAERGEPPTRIKKRAGLVGAERERWKETENRPEPGFGSWKEGKAVTQ